ncbi:MAG: DUF790 family protein, partial [Chloroflexota bacterium]
ELAALFRQHTGRARGALYEALRDYEGDSLDYPILRGLAAVLEARCTFGAEPPMPPAELRAALFGRGPVTYQHDLLSGAGREQVVAETAAAYNLAADQVEAALFADLVEEQLLLNVGEPIGPGEIIGRYNLEVARGILYWARELQLWVQDGYKDVFKYIKLFKLMHTVRLETHGVSETPRVYHVTLYGPLSPFVQSTLRYGLPFARFMPALLLCQTWQMEADVRLPGIGRPLRYRLDDQTELRGHFTASGPFDSQLEADFAAEFEEKYGGAERVWQLAREDELIVVGDTVMIPDFSLTHRQNGRRALLEIVGYWHPDYLRRKLTKVKQAGRGDLILLVYESANVAEGTFEAVAAGEVLTFKNKPVLKDVLAAVERCAV